MSGDYMVSHEGQPVGRVMRFDGAKASGRWSAFSVHRNADKSEASASFPTRRAATVWLIQRHQAQLRP